MRSPQPPSECRGRSAIRISAGAAPVVGAFNCSSESPVLVPSLLLPREMRKSAGSEGTPIIIALELQVLTFGGFRHDHRVSHHLQQVRSMSLAGAFVRAGSPPRSLEQLH